MASGAEDRNGARLDALHADVARLRERVHDQDVEVATMKAELEGLASLPEIVTGMRVEWAALKGRLVMVGVIVALIVPAVTAALVRLLVR